VSSIACRTRSKYCGQLWTGNRDDAKAINNRPETLGSSWCRELRRSRRLWSRRPPPLPKASRLTGLDLNITALSRGYWNPCRIGRLRTSQHWYSACFGHRRYRRPLERNRQYHQEAHSVVERRMPYKRRSDGREEDCPEGETNAQRKIASALIRDRPCINGTRPIFELRASRHGAILTSERCRDSASPE